MSWPRHLCESALEFVTAATSGPWPGMADQAQRLLERIRRNELERPAGGRPSPSRARPRGGVDKSGLSFAPPSHPGRADRRATRTVRIRDDRFGVMRRARGRCEFRCALAGEPTEAHHVFGGADRRALESEFTLAAICETCHDRCDASPAWAREQALAWARRLLADAAAAGVERSIAGFAETVEQLQARIALAAAQAIPSTRTPEPT